MQYKMRQSCRFHWPLNFNLQNLIVSGSSVPPPLIASARQPTSQPSYPSPLATAAEGQLFLRIFECAVQMGEGTGQMVGWMASLLSITFGLSEGGKFQPRTNIFPLRSSSSFHRFAFSPICTACSGSWIEPKTDGRKWEVEFKILLASFIVTTTTTDHLCGCVNSTHVVCLLPS